MHLNQEHTELRRRFAELGSELQASNRKRVSWKHDDRRGHERDSGIDVPSVRDGGLFTPSYRYHSEGSPILEGPDGSEAVLLRRYREFSAWLRPLGQPLRRVAMDVRRAWRVELANGTLLELGRQPSEQSIRLFARVFPALMADRGTAAAQVELTCPDGFAVRWRDEGPREANSKRLATGPSLRQAEFNR